MPESIEKASIKHVDKLYEIEKECFPKDALTKEQIAFLVADCDCPCLICKVEEEIVAFTIGRVITDSRPFQGHILTLDVSSAYRRKGIGTQLLERIEEKLRNKNVKICHLEVREDNTPALTLYQKSGYNTQSTLPKYYGDDDGILLKKNFIITHKYVLEKITTGIGRYTIGRAMFYSKQVFS